MGAHLHHTKRAIRMTLLTTLLSVRALAPLLSVMGFATGRWWVFYRVAEVECHERNHKLHGDECHKVA